MTQSSLNTAILVFIRTEEKEARAKTFHSKIGKKGNRQIASRLNQNIIRTARKTDIPTFILSSEYQKGSCFGEKLANGFEDVFNKGFKNVIALGNDCLTITSKLIKFSAERLNDNEAVVGETTDGGTYLIGLSKKTFFKSDFANLCWETDFLFEDLKAYLNRINAQSHFLPIARDIDSEGDFRTALADYSAFNVFRKSLESIIAGFQKISSSSSSYIPTVFYRSYSSLRAPPF